MILHHGQSITLLFGRSSAEGDYALFQESATSTLPGGIVRALPLHFSYAKRYPIIKDHAAQIESAWNKGVIEFP
jgi:hypothetical protein